MAGIWFSKENTQGRLDSPVTYSADNEGFNSTKDFYFHTLIQVDSSQANQVVPLLYTFSDNSTSGSAYQVQIYIESGIVKVLGSRYGSLGLRGYCESSIPFDELFELVITVHPSQNTVSDRVFILFNGVAQTVHSIYNHKSMYLSAAYFRAILGGDGTSIGNAKGLLMLKASLINRYDKSSIPPTVSDSQSMTLWHWDFEDSSNPLKITTSRQNVSSEIVWTNTGDSTVVWVEGNTPPSANSGGGIIIPGNGNTTRVQGVVTEDDQPVARQVFAFTQALLEVDGSEETKHAVLGSVMSDSTSGSYSLETSPYEGSVIVVAVDDYGDVWQADTVYETGDVIRPVDFQGYVYHCTVAGTGDSTEPTWWFDDSIQTVGTAQFKAKPYTRPLAHGPVFPEIVPES
ncbi:hypothetical protein [Endozoicomonas arenosclerae]|uniref:hypothetical protein n=1 Tax=Endozoicomonas arenosclerae TaxID=1633495 RepID=UPI000785D9F6|nr:hypothetical protein [Endozoicomonas arenosclerae]